MMSDIDNVIQIKTVKEMNIEDIIDHLVENEEAITDLYIVYFKDGNLYLRGTGNWPRTCMASVALNHYAQNAVDTP